MQELRCFCKAMVYGTPTKSDIQIHYIILLKYIRNTVLYSCHDVSYIVVYIFVQSKFNRFSCYIGTESTQKLSNRIAEYLIVIFTSFIKVIGIVVSTLLLHIKKQSNLLCVGKKRALYLNVTISYQMFCILYRHIYDKKVYINDSE